MWNNQSIYTVTARATMALQTHFDPAQCFSLNNIPTIKSTNSGRGKHDKENEDKEAEDRIEDLSGAERIAQCARDAPDRSTSSEEFYTDFPYDDTSFERGSASK